MSISSETLYELERAVQQGREAALLRLVAGLMHYSDLCTTERFSTTPDGSATQEGAPVSTQTTSPAAAVDDAHLAHALAAAAGDVREQIRDVELAFTPPGQLWAEPLQQLLADRSDNHSDESADGEAREDAAEDDDWPTDLAVPDLSALELTDMLTDVPVIDTGLDVPRCTPVWGDCDQEQWLLLGDGEALGSRVRQRADVELYLDLGRGPVCLQGTREEAVRWLLQAAAIVAAAPSHEQAPTNREDVPVSLPAGEVAAGNATH